MARQGREGVQARWFSTRGLTCLRPFCPYSPMSPWKADGGGGGGSALGNVTCHALPAMPSAEGEGRRPATREHAHGKITGPNPEGLEPARPGTVYVRLRGRGSFGEAP